VTDEGGILTNLIWAVQMPGFMWVSGYFGARAINDFSNLQKSIHKSNVRYLLPFLSWWVFISVLLLGRYNHNPIKALIALAQRVDRGLWFLWVVYILSIVFALCNWAVSKGKSITTKAAFVSAMGILSGGIMLLISRFAEINLFGIKIILYYSVFYGFGWLVHITEEYWKQFFTDSLKYLLLFVCFVVFVAICYNYDLYRSEGGIISIVLHLIAGFTGNAVLLGVVEYFHVALLKCRVDWIGTYTLEIYAAHMYVNKLFMESNTNPFFTLSGFGNFTVSLICTVLFTTIIIAVIKSIPAANYILFGKRSR
jgi:hypothetical protein